MSEIDYTNHLPSTPEGIGWHLSWMDLEKQSTLVIALHVDGECVHRKVLAVDLYGVAGVRETGQWMLDKWRERTELVQQGHEDPDGHHPDLRVDLPGDCKQCEERYGMWRFFRED